MKSDNTPVSFVIATSVSIQRFDCAGEVVTHLAGRDIRRVAIFRDGFLTAYEDVVAEARYANRKWREGKRF